MLKIFEKMFEDIVNLMKSVEIIAKEGFDQEFGQTIKAFHSG